jgi:hypothetical protein
MPHFSLAFFARIDVGAALNEITNAFKGTFGLAKERPRCAGKPLSLGQTKYTLPERYLSNGDGIVWPCLSQDGQRVVLNLTAASGLPYLVRVNPKATLTYGGTVDLGKAVVIAGYKQFVKNPPYTQALLVPGSSISYSFKANDLPGIAVAKLDVGTHLALSTVWAVQFILTIIGMKIPLLENAEVLSCLGDAVEAGTQDKKLSGAGIGALIKAAISCTGPVIRAAGGIVTKLIGAVLGVLADGVGLVVGGIEGIIRTAAQRDIANIQIGRRIDTGLANSPFVGDWFVHGRSLTIRSDGTATIRYRYGSCESAPPSRTATSNNRCPSNFPPTPTPPSRRSDQYGISPTSTTHRESSPTRTQTWSAAANNPAPFSTSSSQPPTSSRTSTATKTTATPTSAAPTTHHPTTAPAAHDTKQFLSPGRSLAACRVWQLTGSGA